MKDKKSVTATNAFQKILDNSKRKPNKIWTDQGSEFYNKSSKKMLQENNTGMFSTHNEGKSVVVNKIYKQMTAVSKNVYFDFLDDIVNEYNYKIYKHMTAVSKNVYFDVLDDIANELNNTYHRTIKMKSIDVKTDSFAEHNEKSTEKDPRFKIGNYVMILKYKNIFAKSYTPNWSGEVFVISKIKNTVPWTYIISDLNGEEIVGSFYEKELQKTNQKEFRIGKIIKRKGNKLYVKWKGYDHSFNSWIGNKDTV